MREKLQSMNLSSLLPRGEINRLAKVLGFNRRTVRFALIGDDDVKEETVIAITAQAAQTIKRDIEQKQEVLKELHLLLPSLSDTISS